MSDPLPALRSDLELMPSPVPEAPGLLVRDPFRYASGVLVLPSPLVPCLMYFDGRHEESDLRRALVELTGDVRVGELIAHLRDTLSGGGFLEDAVYEGLRDHRHRAFVAEPVRPALHAGSAYPNEPEALRALLAGYLEEAPEPSTETGSLIGVAAPHVSLEGGWRSYGAAYRVLKPEHADRTFVILGTSHYGRPERFGLTLKPFQTPLGATSTDAGVVERLVEDGGEAVCLEDYCHAIEHSIEFQVVFLQHLFGPSVRVVPVLCGAFARATRDDGRPEDDEGVSRFLDSLGRLAADQGDRLLWVLGVDMAHVGQRYGDRFAVQAGAARMRQVEAADRERLDSVAAADATGLWEKLRRGGDPLKWCGASPLYAFLAGVRPRRGALLHYEHWNIDPQSVVSCAALSFWR